MGNDAVLREQSTVNIQKLSNPRDHLIRLAAQQPKNRFP